MLKVSVCIGSACHLKGSYSVINAFKQAVEKNDLKDKIEIGGTFCLGRCGENVSVLVNNENYNVSPEDADQFFNDVVMKQLQ